MSEGMRETLTTYAMIAGIGIGIIAIALLMPSAALKAGLIGQAVILVGVLIYARRNF